MKYTQEQKDQIYALRGIKSSTEAAAIFGISKKAVCKHWIKERVRRGDPILAPVRKRHPRTDEVYALRGIKSTPLIAKELGMKVGTVQYIMDRERQLRGDPRLDTLPRDWLGSKGSDQKIPQEFFDEVYALRGVMPASVIAEKYGTTKGVISGMWRRERKRRNDQEPIKRQFKIKGRPRKKSAEPTYQTKRRQVTVAQRIDPAKPGCPVRLHTAQTFSLREVVARPVNGGQGVSLFDLTSCQCHYPLGDFLEPATFFCGAVTAEGRSYCAPHYALCTSPVVINEERLAA